MNCSPVCLSYVCGPGLHRKLWSGFSRVKRRSLTLSLPGLPGIIILVVLYKIAGRHSFSYPLSFLSRYLERLVRCLVYLPVPTPPAPTPPPPAAIVTTPINVPSNASTGSRVSELDDFSADIPSAPSISSVLNMNPQEYPLATATVAPKSSGAKKKKKKGKEQVEHGAEVIILNLIICLSQFDRDSGLRFQNFLKNPLLLWLYFNQYPVENVRNLKDGLKCQLGIY